MKFSIIVIFLLIFGFIGSSSANADSLCWFDFDNANSDGVTIGTCGTQLEYQEFQDKKISIDQSNTKIHRSSNGSNDESNQITINEDILVIEEESNPIMSVGFGTKDMRGLYELTRLDRITDVWTDEYDNTYQYHGNDYFTVLKPAEKPFINDKTTAHGIDRNNNMFGMYIEGQDKLAKKTICQIYEGLCNPIPFAEIDNIFTHEYPYTYSSKFFDPEIVEKMLYEEMKAKKYLKYMESRFATNFH